MPLAAPTLVSPANGVSVSGTSITYQWNPVPGAASYYLIVSTSSNPGLIAPRKFYGNVGNVTSYTDGGYASSGTTYYWWVWAVAADGTTYSPYADVLANGRSFTNQPPLLAAPTLVSPANGGYSWRDLDHLPVEPCAWGGVLLPDCEHQLQSGLMAPRKFYGNVGNVTSYTDSGYASMAPRTTGGCGLWPLMAHL